MIHLKTKFVPIILLGTLLGIMWLLQVVWRDYNHADIRERRTEYYRNTDYGFAIEYPPEFTLSYQKEGQFTIDKNYALRFLIFRTDAEPSIGRGVSKNGPATVVYDGLDLAFYKNNRDYVKEKIVSEINRWRNNKEIYQEQNISIAGNKTKVYRLSSLIGPYYLMIFSPPSDQYIVVVTSSIAYTLPVWEEILNTVNFISQ